MNSNHFLDGELLIQAFSAQDSETVTQTQNRILEPGFQNQNSKTEPMITQESQLDPGFLKGGK